MMLRAVLLVSCVAAPAAFAAGLWQGQHAAPQAAVVAPRVNAPLMQRPGSGVSDAGRYFASLNAPPPPPPPPPAPAPPPPPPPPDIGLLFRRDVSAVLANSGAEPRVVLSGRRILSKGDIYLDGWRVASVDRSAIVLSKGRERRSIALFSPPAPGGGEDSVLPPAAPVPKMALANARAGAGPNPAQISKVVSAFRSAGLDATGAERLRLAMSQGRFDQAAAMQLIYQLYSSQRFDPSQATAIGQALTEAKIIQDPSLPQARAPQTGRPPAMRLGGAPVAVPLPPRQMSPTVAPKVMNE